MTDAAASRTTLRSDDRSPGYDDPDWHRTDDRDEYPCHELASQHVESWEPWVWEQREDTDA